MSLVDAPGPAGNMAGMNPAKHAPAKTRTPGLGAAWAVLIGTGVTSVTYNVVHAVPVLELALALLLGFMPAFVAACLSHVAAVLDAPWQAKAAVVSVMLGGMVLSANNTAAVVAPAEPGWRGWLFGIVLDAGALLALWAILAARRRNNTAAVAAVSARAEAEAATVRAGQLEAELTTVRAELEAAREAVQLSGPQGRSKPARKTARTAPVDDVALEARALELLATDLDMTGAELARRLGVTAGYGRKLRRKLTQPDRPVDRSGSPSQDRRQDR